MKKILLITTLFVLAGCQQLQYQMMSSTDVAILECKKIGYVEGTNEFKECVQIQAMSIRNARAASARSAESARLQSQQNLRNSMGTICRSDGEFTYCN